MDGRVLEKLSTKRKSHVQTVSEITPDTEKAHYFICAEIRLSYDVPMADGVRNLLHFESVHVRCCLNLLIVVSDGVNFSHPRGRRTNFWRSESLRDLGEYLSS